MALWGRGANPWISPKSGVNKGGVTPLPIALGGHTGEGWKEGTMLCGLGATRTLASTVPVGSTAFFSSLALRVLHVFLSFSGSPSLVTRLET